MVKKAFYLQQSRVYSKNDPKTWNKESSLRTIYEKIVLEMMIKYIYFAKSQKAKWTYIDTIDSVLNIALN